MSGVVSVCVVLLCISCCCASSKSINTDQREDVKLTEPIPIEEHIRGMGYPVETHTITTEDGYILTYHRIPHGKHGATTNGKHTTTTTTTTTKPSKKRPPVFVQHGLLAVSPVWATVNGSLGYVLADAGYDVWLGNARGTEYSRRHVKYDPDKDKERFWDFSWHEMGYYDLPAAIDYILNNTRHDKLTYIGHSMGTTMYFVLGATRPEYMDKIKAGVMFAPVAYLKEMKTPILNFMHNVQNKLNLFRRILGMDELMKYSDLWYSIDHSLCANGNTAFICRDLLFEVVGYDNKELSKDLLPEYLDYMPGGTSFKTILHYGQIIDADFKQFDYGFIRNLWKYHSLIPPSYNLSRVDAPTYFYVAPNDWIATPNTVVETAKQMPNLKGLTMVVDPLFNHADFMWAVDIDTLVYTDLLETLKKHHT